MECVVKKSNIKMKSRLDMNISSGHEGEKTLVHGGKKPVKCDICNYTFSLKSSLKRHVASIHEGNKPFKCDICNYMCSLKGNLKKHVSLVHEDNKSFKCGICDYSCSLKSMLHQSMKERSHSNVTFVTTIVLKGAL